MNYRANLHFTYNPTTTPCVCGWDNINKHKLVFKFTTISQQILVVDERNEYGKKYSGHDRKRSPDGLSLTTKSKSIIINIIW